MAYTCPVCGFSDLPEPPANFSICPSCGTEFGYDDAKTSYAHLRQEWIIAGAPWFSRARRPSQQWNPWLQLISAGFAYALDMPFQAEFRSSQSQWAQRSIDIPMPGSAPRIVTA